MREPGHRRRWSGRAVLTLATALSAAAAPAPAQQPASPGPVPGDTIPRDTIPGDTIPGDTIPGDTVPGAAEAIPLDPVRVTVLRTPLPPSRVPYAVTVERATETGAGLSLADILGAVPGVQVDARYAFSEGDRIAIRGRGARAQFGVRGVKVLVDGVPATLPDGQSTLSHVDPWMVRRAEVLRGPASAVWGNAAGGVLQLETTAPAGPIGGSVLAGTFGLRRLAATAGWEWRSERPSTGASPSPTFRFGATASLFSWDGHREHGTADKRYVTAKAEWRGSRDRVDVVVHGVDYDALSAGSLTADQLAADRFQANPFNVVQATGESASQLQAGVTWERRLGAAGAAGAASPALAGSPAVSGEYDEAGSGPGARLRVAAWVLGRTLDNPIPPAIIGLDRLAAGVRLSIDGRASVGGGPAGGGPAASSVPNGESTGAGSGRVVDWLVGLDVEGQRDDRVNYENDAGRRGELLLDQTEGVGLVAPFVEAGVRLAGSVRARGGLRWDVYGFRADDDAGVAGDPDDSGSRRMSHLSPSFGLVADLGPASLYGSVASSFQTPTTTELVNRPSGAGGLNPDLEPQRSVSLEVGGRARVGPGGSPALVLQAAAYRTAIADVLIPFEVAGAPGRSFFRNAGSAVHRGAEVDAWIAPAGLLGAGGPVPSGDSPGQSLAARALRGLTLRLGYAWIDARYDDFRTADADYSGSRVPGIAPHRWTGSVRWERGGGGSLAVEHRRVARFHVDDANTASAPAYSLTTLRAAAPSMRLAGTRVEAFAELRNLFDREYVSSVVVNAFGARYYEPGPGRSVSVGIRLDVTG